MRVNVVHAVVGKAWEVDLDCPVGTTVMEAIELALNREEFTAVNLAGDEIFAVWNEVVDRDHVLQHGDRVEILRELVISPIERRRMHAKLSVPD